MATSTSPVPAPATTTPASCNVEWTASLKYNLGELGDTFVVLFFLGPIHEDGSNLMISPNIIGTECRMIHHMEGPGRPIIRSGGGVYLDDRKIMKFSGLRDLTPENVVPFLRENLNWVVIEASLCHVGQLIF